jgi:hypothetical protein
MRRIMPSLAVWLFAGAFCQGADWPQFRGPGANATAADALPTEWSGETNMLWKVKLPGPGSSSPITLGERIYVTCYTGYGTLNDDGNQADLTRHLYCLDRRDGRELWKLPLHEKSAEAPYRGNITQHGYASSTPATDGKRLYLLLGTAGVVAFDLDGKELWRTNVGNGTHQWGSGSSVVLTDDLVIVSAAIESNALLGLDKTDGRQVWRVGVPKASFGTPAFVVGDDGSQTLVFSGERKMIGVDAKTGKELWHCAGINDYVCPAVVPGKGIAYACGARSNEIIAVRMGGSGDVSSTHIAWRARIGANVPTPVLYGDYLFGGNDQGIAYCVDAKTGEIKYRERLTAGAAAAGDAAGRGGQAGRGGRGGGGGGVSFYASMVVAGDKLYAVTRTSGTFVIAPTPEFKLLAHNSIDADKSRFDATPAISDGKLLIRSNEALYCIGAKP